MRATALILLVLALAVVASQPVNELAYVITGRVGFESMPPITTYVYGVRLGLVNATGIVHVRTLGDNEPINVVYFVNGSQRATMNGEDYITLVYTKWTYISLDPLIFSFPHTVSYNGKTYRLVSVDPGTTIDPLLTGTVTAYYASLQPVQPTPPSQPGQPSQPTQPTQPSQPTQPEANQPAKPGYDWQGVLIWYIRQLLSWIPWWAWLLLLLVLAILIARKKEKIVLEIG
jgi:hypothetical protein